MTGLSENRFLLVGLQDEKYAIDLIAVKEVIAPTDTTPIPFSPKHFLGLLNLRGELIPVIDLRLKMNLLSKSESSEKAVVIIDIANGIFGLIVDSVNSVETFSEAQTGEIPQMEKAIQMDFVKSVAKVKEELILILALENILETNNKLNKRAA